MVFRSHTKICDLFYYLAILFMEQQEYKLYTDYKGAFYLIIPALTHEAAVANFLSTNTSLKITNILKVEDSNGVKKAISIFGYLKMLNLSVLYYKHNLIMEDSIITAGRLCAVGEPKTITIVSEDKKSNILNDLFND